MRDKQQNTEQTQYSTAIANTQKFVHCWPVRLVHRERSFIAVFLCVNIVLKQLQCNLVTDKKIVTEFEIRC